MAGFLLHDAHDGIGRLAADEAAFGIDDPVTAGRKKTGHNSAIPLPERNLYFIPVSPRIGHPDRGVYDDPGSDRIGSINEGGDSGRTGFLLAVQGATRRRTFADFS
ncbi:hypothetical protein GCM10020370_65480 [Paenibacillus hodogayensis]